MQNGKNEASTVKPKIPKRPSLKKQSPPSLWPTTLQVSRALADSVHLVWSLRDPLTVPFRPESSPVLRLMAVTGGVETGGHTPSVGSGSSPRQAVGGVQAEGKVSPVKRALPVPLALRLLSSHWSEQVPRPRSASTGADATRGRA